MKKNAIRRLKKVLDDDLKNFENYSLNDADKAKALQSIGKEFALIAGADKDENERKTKKNQAVLEKEKVDFEKVKFNYEKEVKDKQLQIDEQKFEIEKMRLHHEIENAKIQNQLAITKMENDYKSAKIQIIIAAVGVGSTFVLGLISKIIYAKLAHNAQIREYTDYKLEPKSSQENRQNLLK